MYSVRSCLTWGRKYIKSSRSIQEKDKEAFALHSRRFLELLKDVDILLRTRTEFNFDQWLTDARAWGTTDEEQNLFEKNASSLVTIWGDRSMFVSSIIHGANGPV